MTKHRILIVGTGSIGTRHVRCMLSTGRTDVGICEPNPTLRDQVASEYELAGAFADLDEALAESWGAAVIATPPPLHIPLSQKLADRGVALLIEKPLAVDDTGIAALARTLEEKQVAAAVAYFYRANPAVRAMRKALLDEKLGKPLQITGVSGQPLDFFRPAYRDIYYAHRDQGGGAVQDGATHLFNLAEWLVGPITRIAVDAQRLRLEGIDVDDTVHAMTRHSHRVMGSYSVNHHQLPNESTLTVVCERGAMCLEIKKHQWKWMDQPNGAWHEEHEPLPDADAWYTLQEHAFLDYLEGRADPLCSLRDGWQTLRVSHAAMASVDQQGQWQTVAPPESVCVEQAV